MEPAGRGGEGGAGRGGGGRGGRGRGRGQGAGLNVIGPQVAEQQQIIERRTQQLERINQREQELRGRLQETRNKQDQIAPVCRADAQNYASLSQFREAYDADARKVMRNKQREQALLSARPQQRIIIAADDVRTNLQRYLAINAGILRRLYDGLDTAVRNLIYWQQDIANAGNNPGDNDQYMQAQDQVLGLYLLVNSFNPQLLANIIGYQGEGQSKYLRTTGQPAARSTVNALDTPEANLEFWNNLRKYNFPHPRLWAFPPLEGTNPPAQPINFDQSIQQEQMQNPNILPYYNQENYAGAYEQFVNERRGSEGMQQLAQMVGRYDPRVRNILNVRMEQQRQ